MTTTTRLPLAIHIAGQASKRGLVPRMPTGARLLADIAAWLTESYPDQARIRGTRSIGDVDSELRLALHPAAPDLAILATDIGRVAVAAETVTAGPGYHRFVGRVLERLGAELAIDWAVDGEAEPGFDGDLAFADRPTVERAYLEWLGPMLAEILRSRRRGATGIHLGTPTGVRYTFEGALATAIGPRDDAWLEAAIADPRVAIDITPWWSDATDGRYLLHRALALMWLEVRWRKPGLEGEADILDEVHRLLARAYPLEPELPYPWTAWAEIIALRGIDDGMTRQVFERTGGRPTTGSRIGYRRDPVTVSHEGWALEVPGAFADRRTDDEWWGGGAGRGVTLAATDTGSMPPASFLHEVAADLGADALTHRAGEVHGRARLSTDASSGLEVGVLDGFAAVTGSGAAIRVTFDDPADWQWALDTWRSLAPG